MDIPDWFVWIFLGIIVLQALGLVPAVRRLRGTDPAARAAAPADLLDIVGALLASVGLLLSLVVAESWFRLAVVGLALIVAAYALKGLRLLRARRGPAA
ncbi:hypothetical protein ACFCXK_12145 [Streptomyces sp. NPDC056269]|uniref:hypothetical protein n=1 Tax=Streptomyces sp. NPDC056269 TaxID=3345768 RepID=UPI0035D75F24